MWRASFFILLCWFIVPMSAAQDEYKPFCPDVWHGEDNGALAAVLSTWQDGEPATQELPPRPWQIYPLGSHLVMPGKQSTLLLMGKLQPTMAMAVWKIDIRRALALGFTRYVAAIDRCGERCLEWTQEIADAASAGKYQLTLPELPPGCYAVTARHDDLQSVAVIVVTNLGLIVKRDDNVLLAWASGRDGKWQSGATDIYLFRHDRQLLSGKTNASGVWAARLPGRCTPLTVLAMQGEHIAIAESPWFRYQHLAQRCHFYFSQACYAPGQTVHVCVVARVWDHQQRSYGLLPEGDTMITLQDPAWRPLVNSPVRFSACGTASLQYRLPEQAPVGRYSVRLNGVVRGESSFAVAPALPNEKTTFAAASQRWRIEPCPPSEDTSEADHNYYVGDQMQVAPRLAMHVPTLVAYENDRLAGYACTAQLDDSKTWNKSLSAALSPCFDLSHSWFGGEQVHHVTMAIAVRQPHQELRIGVIPDKDDYADGESVRLRLAIKDWQNRPVSGEIVMHVLPALQNMGQTPDGFYYGAHVRNEVVTANSYDFSFPHEGELHSLPWPAPEGKTPGRTHTTPGAPLPGITNDWQINTVGVDGETEVTWRIPTSGAWRIAFLAIDAKTCIGETHWLAQRKK